MKKQVVGSMVALLMVGVMALTGCSPSGDGAGAGSNASSSSGEISVYSREAGSGTRGAFTELFGIDQKDAQGKTVDMTTPSAAISNSTAAIMTSVAGDKDAIGYTSLGSLNDTVKALAIDNEKPSVANVESGAYKIVRPFNIITGNNLSDAAKDFITFIMSADGQQVIEKNGYIPVVKNAPAYQPSTVKGKVVLAGSSSLTPVMEKLAEAYKAKNPSVSVEVNQSDSTTGITMTQEKTCDIGMASRDLTDQESASGIQATVIAKDGIAVIVNKDSSLDNLSSSQVKDIYTGVATTWDAV